MKQAASKSKLSDKPSKEDARTSIYVEKYKTGSRR
jgi:hypothetical protein